MRTNAKFIYMVLAGAAVGALFGYLFTTEKGNQLRSDIKEKAMEGADKISETTSNIKEKFRTRTEDLADEIKGDYEKTRSKKSLF